MRPDRDQEKDSMVQIRRSRAQDTPRIVQITDAEFGAGYFVRRYEAVLHSDPAIDTFVADLDGTVVGFVSVITVDRRRLESEFGMTTDIKGTHGVLKIAAVDFAHQRKGIGSSLMYEAIDALESRGVAALWGSAWINPSTGMASNKMLERAGLVQIGQKRDFWFAESLMFPRWQCSECNGPCRCAAMIYFKSTREWGRTVLDEVHVVGASADPKAQVEEMARKSSHELAHGVEDLRPVPAAVDLDDALTAVS